MGEGTIPRRSSGPASPVLQAGSPGTHIPRRAPPAASDPHIFSLGVSPDPRPGSRCGAASPRPRPSSLPLFLGRGMAPAHVPAPPALESGGRAELRLLLGGEAPSPAAPSPSHRCKPPGSVQGGLRELTARPSSPLPPPSVAPPPQNPASGSRLLHTG